MCAIGERGGDRIKLKQGILTHRVDDDYITVFTSEEPGDFHGILRSNEAANFIMDCLKEDVTEDEILARMQDAYSGDPELMREDIQAVLGNLRKANALVE